MKILNLSIDKSIFDNTSATAERIVAYSELTEKYTVVAPNVKNQKISLSYRANVHGVGGSSKIFQFFNIYKFTSQLLSKERYDLITVQDQYYLAGLGLLLARKYKIGLEIQVHGIEKYGGLRKIVAHYILPRADTVRTVSSRLKKYLLDAGVNESKITVVPVYAGEIEIANNKEYKLKNPAVILTICRLVPIKNIELQLKSLADLS